MENNRIFIHITDSEEDYDDLPYNGFTYDDLTTYNNLLRERRNYENEIYDFLENGNLQVPVIIDESFWEPVKIGYGYTNIQNLEDIIVEEPCIICTESHINFKQVHCCHQKLCNGCCYTWFDSSVKCPYCHQDIRDFSKI